MRNPRRQNRNIGTKKSGKGADNRLGIPQRWSSSAVYWQQLEDFVVIEQPINGHLFTFLVEPPRAGYIHHCTVQDVAHVLEMLPIQHIEGIKLVVFRQPTVKQNLLAPVWGRMGYESKIGKYEGPGIYLDAQPMGLIIKWDRSLQPDDQAELNRFRKVGFLIEERSRGYHIHTTPESIRNSQLYRTLPHEVGHYRDYVECRQTYKVEDDDERFWELYDAKPSQEKEVYAHRYADEFWREMESANLIPFAPIYNLEMICNDHLQPEWFVPH